MTDDVINLQAIRDSKKASSASEDMQKFVNQPAAINPLAFMAQSLVEAYKQIQTLTTQVESLAHAVVILQQSQIKLHDSHMVLLRDFKNEHKSKCKCGN